MAIKKTLLFVVLMVCCAQLVSACGFGDVKCYIKELMIETIQSILLFGNQAAHGIFGFMAGLILENPKFDEGSAIKEMQWNLVGVCITFFVFGLMWNGLKLMSSDSPIKREEAKRDGTRVLLGILLVVMSNDVYNMGVELSSAMAKSVYGVAMSHVDMSDLLMGLLNINPIVSGLVAISALLATITLIMRFLFMMVIYVLFPAGLFLYFSGIPMLKGFGESILEWFVKLLILQMVFVVIYTLTLLSAEDAGGFLMAKDFSASRVSGLFIVVGMLGMAIAPFFVVRVRRIVGGGVAAIGVATGQPWLAAGGAVVASGSPGPAAEYISGERDTLKKSE